MLVVIATRLILPLAAALILASVAPAEAASVPSEVHPVWRSIGPTVIHRVDPDFPRKAARAGLTEGMVFVQAVIDTKGHPHGLEVIQSEHVGFGFEQAALHAVRKSRFEPFTLNGEVKTVVHIVKVDFHKGQ